MDTGAQINPVELRTNTLRFIERFMRSIEGQGFGGSSFYDTSARFAAEVAAYDSLADELIAILRREREVK
jgi:hypothetical protein